MLLSLIFATTVLGPKGVIPQGPEYLYKAEGVKAQRIPVKPSRGDGGSTPTKTM